MVYPERGTMRIGLWLHDTVKGNLVRVHYFAQKPERDTSRILAQRKISLTITPEFSRLSCRGKLQFQADVVGSEDKSVTWSVKEENGGAIGTATASIRPPSCPAPMRSPRRRVRTRR